MLYREAGQFKPSYDSDQAIFPIVQDKWAMAILLVIAFVPVPLLLDQYWLGPILTQFLVFALAALGLNILTGYAGQLSLGTGGFMAVGAYATYNLALRIPALIRSGNPGAPRRAPFTRFTSPRACDVGLPGSPARGEAVESRGDAWMGF